MSPASEAIERVPSATSDTTAPVGAGLGADAPPRRAGPARRLTSRPPRPCRAARERARPPSAATQVATFAAWPPAPSVIRAGVSSSAPERLERRRPRRASRPRGRPPARTLVTPSPPSSSSSPCRPRAQCPVDAHPAAAWWSPTRWPTLSPTATGSSALESTIISHGLPTATSAATAREHRGVPSGEGGAVPATLAVLDGAVRVGLDDDQLVRVAEDEDVVKASVRDLGPVMAKGLIGATTVAATAYLAAPRRHPGLRHRRPRRRAPRRAGVLGRVGRPGRLAAGAGDGGLRGREVDPRRARHPRAAGVAVGDGARLRHRHVPGLLRPRHRPRRCPGGWTRRRRSPR